MLALVAALCGGDFRSPIGLFGRAEPVAPSRPQEAATGPASVVVPPALAGPLLRVLIRAMRREVREDGGVVPAGIGPFMHALHEAAEAPPPVADDGNAAERPAMVEEIAMVTVAQLAESSGHPHRTLRHWAACGAVTATKVGRTWLIDPASLLRRR